MEFYYYCLILFKLKIKKMNDILNPDNLAHHRTASSLNYKDWDFADVSAWLEEHLKVP
jgi:hypothetical protein